MSSHLRELGARRRALVAQSDALRRRMSISAQGLRQVVAFVDLGVAAGRSMAGRPLLAVGIVVALVVLKPRRALRLLGLGLTAASIFSSLRQFLSALPASRR